LRSCVIPHLQKHLFDLRSIRCSPRRQPLLTLPRLPRTFGPTIC